MRLSIVLSIVLLSTNGFSQFQEKHFYNIIGSECDSASSYTYKVWTTAVGKYTKRGYYTASNSIYSIEPLDKQSYEGIGSYYHENGQLHYEVNFKKNRPDGIIKYFYPNGKIHLIEFIDSTIKERELEVESFIYEYYDSLGQQLVKNGNGIYHDYGRTLNGFNHAYGKVVDGLKDSSWVGFNDKNVLYFEEQWNRGLLIKGHSKWEDGNEYDYEKPMEAAGPSNGMQAFYNYVGRSLVYPKPARRKGIEGYVFVSFIVDKDGTIQEAKVVKGIGGGCDEEAVRVIASSPRWLPGKQKGKPVRSRFNLAIIFKLT